MRQHSKNFEKQTVKHKTKNLQTKVNICMSSRERDEFSNKRRSPETAFFLKNREHFHPLEKNEGLQMYRYVCQSQNQKMPLQKLIPKYQILLL